MTGSVASPYWNRPQDGPADGPVYGPVDGLLAAPQLVLQTACQTDGTMGLVMDGMAAHVMDGGRTVGGWYVDGLRHVAAQSA